MIFETIILPALVPAISDGLRGIFAKFGFGSAEPQNVAERVQLMNAEVSKLQALAQLDNPGGEPSKWVINFRASFRYFAVGGIVGTTVIASFSSVPVEIMRTLLDMSGACMSFVIGERMYLNIKR